MRTKSVPYGLIKDSFEKGLQDTVIYWVQLKAVFKKPIFYNYNTRYIAKILNISPTTASKHIKIILREGWAYVHNKNLCLTSTNTLKKSYNTFIIKVPVSGIKTHQAYYLRHSILYRHCNFQNKQIKIKTEIVKKARNPFGKLKKSEMKKISLSGGINEFEKFNSRLTASNNTIGKYFGRSKSTGARYQKTFNKMGLIKSIPNFQQVNVRWIKDGEFLKYKHQDRVSGCRSGFLSRRTTNTIVLFLSPQTPLALSIPI